MISFSLSKLSDQQKKEVLKLNNQLKEQASIKFNFEEIQLKKDQITVNDTIYQYLVDIEKMINQSGKDFQISPRCLKQSVELAKGWALINQQAFVSHQDIFVNAGGVVVSYFEWIKNLSHIRLGRLEKRYTESKLLEVVRLIEKITNTKTDDQTIKRIVQGADERDLSNSGLEDAIRLAFNEMLEIKMKLNISFRKAAYYLSLMKLMKFYKKNTLVK
jgi:hypothetical protein